MRAAVQSDTRAQTETPGGPCVHLMKNVTVAPGRDAFKKAAIRASFARRHRLGTQFEQAEDSREVDRNCSGLSNQSRRRLQALSWNYMLFQTRGDRV